MHTTGIETFCNKFEQSFSYTPTVHLHLHLDAHCLAMDRIEALLAEADEKVRTEDEYGDHNAPLISQSTFASPPASQLTCSPPFQCTTQVKTESGSNDAREAPGDVMEGPAMPPSRPDRRSPSPGPSPRRQPRGRSPSRQYDRYDDHRYD